MNKNKPFFSRTTTDAAAQPYDVMASDQNKSPFHTLLLLLQSEIYIYYIHKKHIQIIKRVRVLFLVKYIFKYIMSEIVFRI